MARPLRAAAALAALALTPALTACLGPRPSGAWDAPAVTARAAMTDHTDALMQRLQAGPSLTRGVYDACRQGQHNWKIDDPFDWLCRRQITDVTRADGADTAAVIAATVERVRAAGCAPEAREVDMVTRYWANYGLRGSTDSGRPYGIDDLPSFRAACADGITLESSFNSAAGVPRALFPYTADEQIEAVPAEASGLPEGTYVIFEAAAVYHRVPAR
ncbi:hypothetical protein G7070_15970 [Propioniciclava coleopterorum]|uniref:Lipoprotein n=1 Tax=Propioniciclava coleopterorum TaxID=2714937 RepID=A0A6G7Y9L2_9ACTN|nr:hypothetical protein [Propioniciclava coleopterorum]QIK73483.1 hypothetical protein G7070_15970 [Propioniciclava coleopterorum]